MEYLLNNVRRFRKNKGFTQIALASAVGIGRSTLSEIESGIHIPGVDVALRLAKTLDCTVENLFYIEKREKGD